MSAPKEIWWIKWSISWGDTTSASFSILVKVALASANSWADASEKLTLFGVEGESTTGFSNNVSNGGSELSFEGGVERETSLGRLLGLCL